MKDTVYYLLPNNPAKDSNSVMYGRFNRTGVVNATKDCTYPFVLYVLQFHLCGVSRQSQELVEVYTGWICPPDFPLRLCYIIV